MGIGTSETLLALLPLVELVREEAPMEVLGSVQRLEPRWMQGERKRAEGKRGRQQMPWKLLAKSVG